MDEFQRDGDAMARWAEISRGGDGAALRDLVETSL